MKSKQQIKEDISLISNKKHSCDHQFSNIQKILASQKSKSINVVKLRKDFTLSIASLSQTIRQNTKELQLLKYKCERLVRQGNQMGSQFRNIESLQQYFQELKKKVKYEQSKGEQILTEREKWQLINGEHENQGIDEEAQLLSSRQAARQTKEMAQGVLQSLSNQGGRLSSARDKMGSVLKNINLAGNILQMIKTRSKEDNRLIVMLSIGLVVQILICVFIIKPYFRGS